MAKTVVEMAKTAFINKIALFKANSIVERDVKALLSTATLLATQLMKLERKLCFKKFYFNIKLFCFIGEAAKDQNVSPNWYSAIIVRDSIPHIDISSLSKATINQFC